MRGVLRMFLADLPSVKSGDIPNKFQPSILRHWAAVTNIQDFLDSSKQVFPFIEELLQLPRGYADEAVLAGSMGLLGVFFYCHVLPFLRFEAIQDIRRRGGKNFFGNLCGVGLTEYRGCYGVRIALKRA